MVTEWTMSMGYLSSMNSSELSNDLADSLALSGTDSEDLAPLLIRRSLARVLDRLCVID